MSNLLSLGQLRDEVREASDTWLLMADSKQRSRFGRHFEIHSVVASRDNSRSSKSGMTLNELEESELELQKRNWVSSYSGFFGGAQETPGGAVKAVARQKQLDAMEKYIREIFHPSAVSAARAYTAKLTDTELAEFLVVCRSLSIATEQARDKFRSMYGTSYQVPKVEGDPEPLIKLPSSLGPNIKYAPKVKKTRASAMVKPKMNDELLTTHKIVVPTGDKNLLTWAGDVQGSNSRYREDYKTHHQRYKSIIPPVYTVSTACNRLIPDSELVPSVTRPVKPNLAFSKQKRFLVHQTAQAAQPSWHLLYKDGTSYTVGEKHDPGELSVYRMEYAAKSSVVRPALPTIDPFESNIKIKMSDFKYHNTTYADTICQPANLGLEKAATARAAKAGETRPSAGSRKGSAGSSSSKR